MKKNKDFEEMSYGDLVALHTQMTREFNFAGSERKVALSGEIARVAQLMSDKLPDSLNVDHSGFVVPAHADAVNDVSDVATTVRNGDSEQPKNPRVGGEPKKQTGAAK